MEELLKQITAFADRAHNEQMRKYAPDRYIVHPVRVLELCKKYTQDISVLAAALLHDVLEDTPVQQEEIQCFLITLMEAPAASRTVELVIDLTDVYTQKDYPKFNRRERKHKELQRLEKTAPAAQTIKYADIIDNTKEIVKEDPDFARVYLYECRAILRKLDKGHPQLYAEAVNLVDDCILQLKNRK